MNKTEIIETIKKLSKMCGKTTCSQCDFCDKATGECAFARAFTLSDFWGGVSTFLPPSEWIIEELCNDK